MKVLLTRNIAFIFIQDREITISWKRRAGHWCSKDGKQHGENATFLLFWIPISFLSREIWLKIARFFHPTFFRLVIESSGTALEVSYFGKRKRKSKRQKTISETRCTRESDKNNCSRKTARPLAQYNLYAVCTREQTDRMKDLSKRLDTRNTLFFDLVLN